MQRLFAFLFAALVSGCQTAPVLPGSLGQPVAASTLHTSITDREFLWNQIVDTVDDYFRVRAEERVRIVDGVLIEGRIDTWPQPGATIFEPWRSDSTRGFERWHATTQSIRRTATVHVIPAEGGFLVDVAVLKEIEDLDRPERATSSSTMMHHGGSLVQEEDRFEGGPVTLGWIPLGRDVTLEHRLLAELNGRLAGAQPFVP